MSTGTSSTTNEQWELWDEKTLADRLGVSVRTVQGWRARSVGPKWVKLGGAVRYRPGTVAHWMEQLEEDYRSQRYYCFVHIDDERMAKFRAEQRAIAARKRAEKRARAAA